MRRHSPLGEFEQLVLLTILQLEDEAYGPRISGFLDDSVGRGVSRGALYSSLARLGDKGFLDWQIDASNMDQGGRPNRRFSVTDAGMTALRANRSVLLTLWSGLESRLGD